MKLINSPLCESLGVTPTLQLLSFLLAHPNFDYTKTELAKNLELARQTIYKAIEPLLKYKIIIESRKIGNTILYKLNENSETVKAIESFNKTIVDIIIQNQKDFEITNGVNENDLIEQFRNK